MARDSRFLRNRFQIDPIGHLPHKLVEQIHGFGAISLQRLDHFFALQQCGNLLLEQLDFIDLLVEACDLAFEIAVAAALILELTA